VDFITYHDTLLEYYLHIDASKLSDKEWVKKIAALKQIRIEESVETNESLIIKGITQK